MEDRKLDGGVTIFNMGKLNVNVTEVAQNGIIGMVLYRRVGFSVD
jgi:hypothetical protein